VPLPYVFSGGVGGRAQRRGLGGLRPPRELSDGAIPPKSARLLAIPGFQVDRELAVLQFPPKSVVLFAILGCHCVPRVLIALTTLCPLPLPLTSLAAVVGAVEIVAVAVFIAVAVVVVVVATVALSVQTMIAYQAEMLSDVQRSGRDLCDLLGARSAEVR